MTTNESPSRAVPRAIARLARVFECRLGDDAAMSLAQYRVLAFLGEGEWAASALADWLSVSRPSVTAMVDGLVERGWVEREASSEDRRKVLHRLTEDGRGALEGATDVVASVLDGLLDHLDDDERARADDGLALLTEAIVRHNQAVLAR